MKLRAGLITAAIAVIALLSGCSMHPGAAAVVDGQRISVDTVDEAAESYCKLSLAEGDQPLSKGDARRQALADLIQSKIAESLAKKYDLELDPDQWSVPTEVKTQLVKAFDEDDIEGIETVLERTDKTQSILTETGKAKSGSDSDEAGTEAGEGIMKKALAEYDTDIDPRFGLELDEQIRQVELTGSLSVAKAGKEDRAENMAKTQQCS